MSHLYCVWRKISPGIALSLALSLSACGTVKGWVDKDWFNKDEQEEEPVKKVEGERFTVLGTRAEIAVDPSLEKEQVTLVQPIETLSWPQRGANASNALGAVKSSGFKQEKTAKIGKGEAWDTVLVTAPVVADGVIYAMDAKGYISAHDQKKISSVLWVSEALATEDEEDVLGGGLAIAGEQLFVSTGQGEVFALNAKNGTVIWRRNIGIPMRSAPKLQLGTLYVSTVDNQVFALDSGTGNIQWQHRGLGERVGFLSASSPAIGENFVAVAYSSGEIYGLAADSGQEIWNDSLALTRKTSATSVFTGFEGDPVIAGGVVFASSSNGLTAATHLLTGRRLWEQEISAADTPWLASDYLFLLTTDAQLVAVHARDGRVKWTQKLPRYEDAEKQKGLLRWHGPVMLNGQLAVVGEHGVLLLLSPQDGKQEALLDIDEDVRTAPVVAGGTVYFITGDAKLHAFN